jgi:hypothetical protein
MTVQNQPEVTIVKITHYTEDTGFFLKKDLWYMPVEYAEKYAPSHLINESAVALKDVLAHGCAQSPIDPGSLDALVIETSELAFIVIDFNHAKLAEKIAQLSPFLLFGSEFFEVRYPGIYGEESQFYEIDPDSLPDNANCTKYASLPDYITK